MTDYNEQEATIAALRAGLRGTALKCARLQAENEAQKQALADQLTARKHNEAELAAKQQMIEAREEIIAAKDGEITRLHIRWTSGQETIAALRAENERFKGQGVAYPASSIHGWSADIARTALSKLGENDDGRELQRKNLKHGWAK